MRGDFTVEAARQYLARFRFWGDDPLRVVSGFSGGERSRLALAKLLLEPRNLLFLDEPTNHLDIPAAEILEEALVGFEGTVILVSHDRRFLENVTTRVVSVRDGRAEVYPGGFRDYEQVERHRHAPKAAKAADAPPEAKEREGRDGRAVATRRKKKYEEQRQRARGRSRRRSGASRSSRRRSRRARRSSTRSVRKLKRVPGDDWEKLAKMAHGGAGSDEEGRLDAGRVGAAVGGGRVSRRLACVRSWLLVALVVVLAARRLQARPSATRHGRTRATPASSCKDRQRGPAAHVDRRQGRLPRRDARRRRADDGPRRRARRRSRARTRGRTRDRVFVADLRQARPDGTYPGARR